MSDNDTRQREDALYPHAVRAIKGDPWLLTEPKFRELLALADQWENGERLSAEDVQSRIGSGPARRDLQMAGTVAIIPLYGVIAPRADLFTQISGGTSAQRIQDTFEDAVADSDVTAIVFDIDSPGGSTGLIPELAAAIRGARGKKPTAAVANTRAASAAYWIGSQADEFVVTPSGDVGSIGVFAAHQDISKMQEKLGVNTTLVSAGPYKTEGNPFEPLSDDALQAIQALVDEWYGTFVADVAKGRRVPVAKVRDDFGQGRMVTARNALKAGMVDRIDTLEATVQRLARGPVQVPVPDEPAADDLTDEEASSSGLSFTAEARALHDSARALDDRLSSLAEVQRGRLTAAKREPLSACSEALREVAEHFDEVLAATDHEKQQELDDPGIDAEFDRHLARLHL